MTASNENEEDIDSGNVSGTRRGLSAQQHWKERMCRGMMFSFIEHGNRPTAWMRQYIDRNCGYATPRWVADWRRRMSTSENNEENTDSMISTTEDDEHDSGNVSGTRRGLSAAQDWKEMICRGMMFSFIEHGNKPTAWERQYADRHCWYALPSWIADWRRRMSTSENNEENTDSMISTTEDDGQNTDSDIEAGSGRRKLTWWLDDMARCKAFGGREACDRGDWWACMMCNY
jgi:ribosomal protein L17